MVAEKSGNGKDKTQTNKVMNGRITKKKSLRNGTISDNPNTSKLTSACKRCKQKKIKCDKYLPSCKNCAKAAEPCISIDPATGEDMPRSYVLFLEDTIQVLMKKLEDKGAYMDMIRGNIPTSSVDPPFILGKTGSKYYLPNDALLGEYLINRGHLIKGEMNTDTQPIKKGRIFEAKLPETASSTDIDSKPFEYRESSQGINRLASLKASDSNSFLGDSSGVSFAKLVFTAANFKPELVVDDSDEELEQRDKTLQDYDIDKSVDGAINLMELPSKENAQELIIRYFTYTNIQLPILHREYFLKKYFEPIYGPWDYNVSLISDYTRINESFELPTNMDNDVTQKTGSEPWYNLWRRFSQHNEIGRNITLPKQYYIPFFFLNIVFAIGYATNVVESDITKVVLFKKRATHYVNSLFSTVDRLEALSGTLLLAIYSLMRPNVPGVWYIMGSVLRLTVDLGLHTEKINMTYDPFTREIRRRLFWTVYSLDRQVCSYFGRPFGIPEESITTRFPSSQDDAQIVPNNRNISNIQDYSDEPNLSVSSKVVAISMFKIRQIQASIVKVLYAPNSELPREFSDIEEWRTTVLYDLDKWYFDETPKTSEAMNCKFNTFVFDLNYHYSKIVLYGLSPKCPTLTNDSFRVVLDSTKGTIDVFHNLCITHKLSYTWVAVHNTFMTGMTYLYVIYYSGEIMLNNNTDIEEYTTKVLNILKELIGKCDSAKNCYKIYKTLTAVMKRLMSNNTSGNTKDMSNTEIQDQNLQFSTTNNNNIPLEQFFSEMEKVNINPTLGMTNNTLEQLSGGIRLQDTANNSSVTERERNIDNPIIDKRGDSKHQDGQNIMDLLYQVSSQSIWDELFVKNSSKDGNISGMFF